MGLRISLPDERIRDLLDKIALDARNFGQLERLFEKGKFEKFNALIEKLGFQEYRLLICRYFCWRRCERFIRVICRSVPEVVPRLEQFKVRRIMEEPALFSSLLDAYRKQDGTRFEATLRKYDLLNFCYIIVRWLCFYECDVFCLRRCAIGIDAVKFNHDPTSLSNDAMNVRKNYTQTVSVPEWTLGDTLPEESPVAYSIQDTADKRVTIRVRFTASPLTATAAEIKATGGGSLGPLDAKVVNFTGGVSVPEFVEFELNHNSISSGTIRREDIEWNWMYRCIGETLWHRMGNTRHRIYLVLKEPVAPWKQQPYPDSQNPWIDVLDFSCDWAHGAASLDQAASMITTKVNQPVGNVEYDLPGGGASHYSGYSTAAKFNCTAYMDRLHGGLGNGKYINCTDCASIVGTFSNILGCELWESKMGWSFELNEVIALGRTVWEKPWGNGFYYHEVNWKGNAGLNDPVFDACLKVNDTEDDALRRPDPTARVASLPLNFIFDDPASYDYREKLVYYPYINSCQPVSSEKTRREIM